MHSYLVIFVKHNFGRTTMDKVLEKLKRTRVSATIIGIVSLTWIVVDYFVVMNLYNDHSISFGIDLFLLAISAVSLLAFHIITFVLIYHTYRLTHKIKQIEKMGSEAKSSKIDEKKEENDNSVMRNL